MYSGAGPGQVCVTFGESGWCDDASSSGNGNGIVISQFSLFGAGGQTGPFTHGVPCGGGCGEEAPGPLQQLGGQINQRPILKFTGAIYATSAGAAALGAAAPAIYGAVLNAGEAGFEFVTSNPDLASNIWDFVQGLNPSMDGLPASGSIGEAAGSLIRFFAGY
jgi:hypothetical protein